MRKIKLLSLLLATLFLLACGNTSVLNFQPSIVVDPNREIREEKIRLLEKNIASVNRGHHTFYYSLRDTFTEFHGYTFYISPYIVEERGISSRLTLRFYAKAISNKENIFDRLTIYDDRENKIVIDFTDLKREYDQDGFLIIESGDTIMVYEDLVILERFIDSLNIYVTFEKNSNKYNFKLNDTVRESFLDILRKYKLLDSTFL